jgi:aryl-alcohol dehydrogenase-like predicted oxidoreductase
MKRRTIPGTDLELSVIGMGCWAVGGLWWGDDVRDEVSEKAISAAIDHGINWFDTAPLYGRNHADEVLVKALGPRIKDVIVATKVGIRWDNEMVHAQSDLHAEHIRSDTEASLKRLGVDRIDLLQVHWPCEFGAPLEESLGTLVDLQSEGKIRHFGLCNYNADTLARACEIAPQLVTLQTAYSLVRREYEHGIRDACIGPDPAKPRLGVLAYEALCRGLLTGKFQAPRDFPESDLRARDDRFRGPRFQRAIGLVRMLQQAAAKFGTTPGNLAIGWVANRPGVTAVIVGAKTPEQVAQNAAAAALLDRPAIWPIMDKVAASYRG